MAPEYIYIFIYIYIYTYINPFNVSSHPKIASWKPLLGGGPLGNFVTSSRPGEGYACSRPCGGGLYEMRRNVIAQVCREHQ